MTGPQCSVQLTSVVLGRARSIPHLLCLAAGHATMLSCAPPHRRTHSRLQKCCTSCPISAALQISNTWQRPPGEDNSTMPVQHGFCKFFSVSSQFFTVG